MGWKQKKKHQFCVISFELFINYFIYLFGNLIERNNGNTSQSVNSNCCASQIKDTVWGVQELDRENSVGKKNAVAVQLCEKWCGKVEMYLNLIISTPLCTYNSFIELYRLYTT